LYDIKTKVKAVGLPELYGKRDAYHKKIAEEIKISIQTSFD